MFRTKYDNVLFGHSQHLTKWVALMPGQRSSPLSCRPPSGDLGQPCSRRQSRGVSSHTLFDNCIFRISLPCMIKISVIQAGVVEDDRVVIFDAHSYQILTGVLCSWKCHNGATLRYWCYHNYSHICDRLRMVHRVEKWPVYAWANVLLGCSFELNTHKRDIRTAQCHGSCLTMHNTITNTEE